VLVNRDKPVEKLGKPPLMINEALSAIRQPLKIDTLSITNAYLRYCERVVVGADPGVLTFAALNIFAENIANRGKASDAVMLHAQGNLMNAGLIKVQMTIPVSSPDFSMHYSGSLSAMDLTLLNAFLDVAEQMRIKSGSVQGLTFKIDVAAGRAHGSVHAIYRNLDVAFLDKVTHSEKALDKRITSFLANTFKIKNSESKDISGLVVEGKVNYTRKPENEFMQYLWFSLRSGILDVITF